MAEIFSPLTPVFDSIIEKLRGVWQWFTDLIAPVKATQETLDRCKNVGVAFGKALADALTAPLNVFNSLSGKVGWLLEKLGVIKKSRTASTRLPLKPVPQLVRKTCLIFRRRPFMAVIRCTSQ